MGLPIGSGEIIIKKKGEEREGDIIYFGKNIFGGYATRRTDLTYLVQKECLITGDVGFKDNDGYLYICGRTDRLVKLNGNRIDLNELEDLIFRKYNIICKCTLKNDLIYVYDTKDITNIDDFLYCFTWESNVFIIF